MKLDGRIEDEADDWAMGVAMGFILLAAVLAILVGG